MQTQGGRASPAQLQQLPRGSLRGRDVGLAVGRFAASSVRDLAPRRELGAEVSDNTTGGGIWKINSSTWIWASQGTRHCLLCKLCQNLAKELPGSNSSTFTSVPTFGITRSSPAPSRAVECPAWSSLWCRTGDAQCECPEVLGSISHLLPQIFPPIPWEEQAAGWGRLGPQTPHFQVVCFPQAARGRGQKPLGWVAQGQLGQKVRQGGRSRNVGWIQLSLKTTPPAQTLTGMCLPPVPASRRGAKAGILELNAESVQEGSGDS